MSKLVINKHYRKASDINENSFSREKDYNKDNPQLFREGEVIISNEDENPGLYIITAGKNDTGYTGQGARVINITSPENICLTSGYTTATTEENPTVYTGDSIQSAIGKIGKIINNQGERIDAAINTITGNTDSLGDRVEVLEGKVNTISGDVSTLKTKVSALDSNAVTAATLAGDTYVTGSTSIANNNLAITLTPDVAGAISSVTEQGSLADAKLVKDYVDAEVAEASSSLTQRVGNIEGVLGSNTAYTSSHTVTDALAALESDAVETITVKNTNTNLITTSKTGNNVEFDFDNMVIDCGTY